MPAPARSSQFTLIPRLCVLVSSLRYRQGDADARRAGSFSSFGSRGTRTFSAPPATVTAPMTAATYRVTMTLVAPVRSPQFKPLSVRHHRAAPWILQWFLVGR